MSMSVDGRHVTCDGAGCMERADVPVALRSLLGGVKSTEQIDGWLFAARWGEWKHYCPGCLPRYLKSLSEPSIVEC